MMSDRKRGNQIQQNARYVLCPNTRANPCSRLRMSVLSKFARQRRRYQNRIKKCPISLALVIGLKSIRTRSRQWKRRRRAELVFSSFLLLLLMKTISISPPSQKRRRDTNEIGSSSSSSSSHNSSQLRPRFHELPRVLLGIL